MNKGMNVASEEMVLVFIKKMEEGAKVSEFVCMQNGARFMLSDPLVDFRLVYVNVRLQSSHIAMRFRQSFHSSEELKKLTAHSLDAREITNPSIGTTRLIWAPIRQIRL